VSAAGEVAAARAYIAEVSELLDRCARGELDGELVEWTSVAAAFLRALNVSVEARREEVRST
jgi:hypothetical protein